MRCRHLILDRDGVLNREDPAGGWIARADQWRWEPGALEALRRAAESGLRVTVVTNQSGIGRGVMSAADVAAVHERMVSEAAAAGGRIDAVLVCPHGPDDGCDCRKPAPGLLRRAVDAAGIPPDDTVLIGDAFRDLAAAEAAGIRAVLVRTGKGKATERGLDDPSTAVYDDLACAIAALVEEFSA